MKNRTDVLRMSLEIENYINRLLLFNLGILSNGKETKTFGQKNSLSFKNKIDILYDIDVIDKYENQNFELFMIFRNKFMHNIECESYLDIINDLDNGLKNRLKQHFDSNNDRIDDEISCRKAFINLYISNMKSISKKIKIYEDKIEEKRKLIDCGSEITIWYTDLFFDLVNEILNETIKANINKAELSKFSEIIINKLDHYMKKTEEFKNGDLFQSYTKIVSDEKYLDRFFGVVKK